MATGLQTSPTLHTEPSVSPNNPELGSQDGFPYLRGHKAFKHVRSLAREAKEIYIMADSGYGANNAFWIKTRRADVMDLLRGLQDLDLNAPLVHRWSQEWDQGDMALWLTPSNIDGVPVSYEDFQEAMAPDA